MQVEQLFGMISRPEICYPQGPIRRLHAFHLAIGTTALPA
jgi:hypothetical protein